MQPDFFGDAPAPRYPQVPGHKGGGASKDAAAYVKPKAATLREGVLTCLSLGDATPEEVAAKLGVDILAVRPRFSECLKLNLICKTAERRRSRSGLSSTVWRLVKS